MSGSLAGSVTRPHQQQPPDMPQLHRGKGLGLYALIIQACSLSLDHWESPRNQAAVTLDCSPAGRPRGRGAKAPRLAYEAAGVIRISDDSSTESDGGLDSDFHSSPESLLDDDVVIVDAIGLPADDRGEAQCRLPLPCFSGSEQEVRGT